MSWIVLELINKQFPTIQTDEDGVPLLFETDDEASEEAALCQDGLIVNIGE